MNKKIYFFIFGIVKINFSVCAMEYAPFCDETYSFSYYQESHSSKTHFVPTGAVLPTREEHFDILLGNLSKIQEIHDFDPNILVNNPSEPINFPPKKDITFFKRILPFYSEDYSERAMAFEKEIKAVIRNILKEATKDPYYNFPQSLKVLGGLIPFSNLEVFDIALSDIFKDDQEGLEVLANALVCFREKGELDESCRQKLRLFNKIAGFYFDPQVVKYIICLNNCLTTPKTQLAALAFLRVLQVEGELFRHILPSTLNLAKLPSEKILRRLRSQLAHLNKHKLRTLLDIQQAEYLYNGVVQDLSKINYNLKQIQSHFAAVQKRCPSDLWVDLKGRSEQPLLDINEQWQGINNFIEFLTFKPAMNLLNTLTNEIEVLIPYPFHMKDTVDFLKKRQTIWNMLRKKNKFNNEDELEKNLKEANVFIDKHKAFEAYKNVQSLSHTTKYPEDLYLIDVMEASQEIINNYIGQQKQIDNISKRQGELKRFLTEAAQFPTNGFGNFSNKYKEFCERLKKDKFIDSFAPYDWSTEPTLLENIFHKVNNIPILSKKEKNILRNQRIQEILETIEELRSISQISTELLLESNKHSFEVFIDGKLSILSKKREFIKEIARDLKNPRKITTEPLMEAIKKTYTFDTEISRFKNNLSSVCDKSELIKLEDEFDKALVKISEELGHILNEISLIDDSFSQEFLNKTRFKKRKLITEIFDLEKVKRDYRSDWHVVTKGLQKVLRRDKEQIAASEFFVASIYECLEEIKDYPELQQLESTDQIRNYFFHTDLSDGKVSPLIVHRKDQMDVRIYEDRPGIVAKEVSILSINIKAILEDLKNQLI